MIPRVKICCISSIEEARIAIEAGASALGLVGPMPSGPGIISDELIFQIAKTVPPPIGTFLLTSETSVNEIINHYQRTLTNTIQLVDALTTGTYSELQNALPGVKLVQVIHVLDERAVDEAIEISEHVNAILLDSGNPNLLVKELGGTGRIHNWKLSRKIKDSISIPVFLAGGLKLENIRQAIEEVQPFGIDLCSGVRTNGKLDREKLDRFMNEVLK
ncbi:MAG: phosphoribosylanthranilate isomerase [Bacteroidales bacterium]|nr:phosphoribosylanthranilate isomerase [Bacteroidales bacterium]